MRGMPPIGSVMTPLPYSIDVSEDVVTARVVMEEHDIHHLPVTSQGKIAGVITARDIQVAGALAPSAGPLTVREVCHMPAFVADRADPLDAVLCEMAERQLSSAVVVDYDGKLTGILTLADVCRLYAEALSGHFPQKSRP